jgi:hypothetical protein
MELGSFVQGGWGNLSENIGKKLRGKQSQDHLPIFHFSAFILGKNISYYTIQIFNKVRI